MIIDAPRALPYLRRRVRTLGTIGAALVIVLVAGLALRAPIEGAMLTATLRGATGYHVELGGVRHLGSNLVIDDLRIGTRPGALVAEIPRVEVQSAAGRVTVALLHPRFALLPDRWQSGVARPIDDVLRRLHLERSVVDVSVEDGIATLAGGAVPAAAVRLVDVAGTARMTAGLLTYDLAANLADGAARYPIKGIAQVVDGALSAQWMAPVVPLLPLAGLADGASARVRAGVLRNLTLSYGDAPRAFRLDGRLEGARIDLDGHEISGLHGPIALTGDALGTPGIRGAFDGLPFDFAGETHDLDARWPWDGSSQLRALERLAGAIATTPKLQSMHLEALAPGLAYAEFAASSENGPVAVSALSIDANEPTLRFDTAIAEDHVVSGGERTSAMGTRTHAIAGVNGDYFDIGRTYQPQGMLIRSGELVRGPTDRYALVIDGGRHVSFAEYRLRGRAVTARATFPVTQLNNWPAGHVTVITPAFGKVLPPADGVTFVGLRAIEADAGTYVVDRVVKADAPIPVSFGLAFGKLIHGPLPRRGERVTLSYALDPPAAGAVAGIGGGPMLLKDGAWFEDPHAPAPDERDVRWPVIALGRQLDGALLLVAVDGRHPERSVGMTRPEFAALLQALGATDAMALDSGGSVTLVARAAGDAGVTVRNHPSDDSAERWVSDALFLYSSASAPTLFSPRIASTPQPEARPSP